MWGQLLHLSPPGLRQGTTSAQFTRLPAELAAALPRPFPSRSTRSCLPLARPASAAPSTAPAHASPFPPQPLLTVERQVVGWFEVPPAVRQMFEPAAFPTCLLQDDGGYYYGEPLSISSSFSLLSSNCCPRPSQPGWRCCATWQPACASTLIPATYACLIPPPPPPPPAPCRLPCRRARHKDRQVQPPARGGDSRQRGQSCRL